MSTEEKTKIIIADTQYLVLESLACILDRMDGTMIQAIVDNKNDLCSVLSSSGSGILITDPLLLDYTGVDDLVRIRKDYPKVSVMVLTQVLSRNEFNELRNGGINCFLYKTVSREEFAAALAALLKGKKYYTPDILDLLPENNEIQLINTEIKSLTKSETEIVRMISEGYTNKEIALKKNLSFHTVNTHRKNIFRKLGVTNTSEMIIQAIKSGLIDNIEYYI